MIKKKTALSDESTAFLYSLTEFYCTGIIKLLLLLYHSPSIAARTSRYDEVYPVQYLSSGSAKIFQIVLL